MSIKDYLFGRMRRKDYIAKIRELEDRCDKLADDLKHNADRYAHEMEQADADLQKAQARYVIAERAAQEYHGQADRYERKYRQLEQHLNDMYEAYQAGKYRDYNGAGNADRKDGGTQCFAV